jgi:hypothetical protein
VLLEVYGDESADETKQRVFAVGGVVGTEELWEQIETRWVARTGMIPFHANHCDSDRGDYACTTHSENKALYRDLTTMLAESGLGGWGFVLDLAAQLRVFPDAPTIPYYKCFMEVVQAMRNFAVTNHGIVKFIFDMRHESEYNAGLLYGMLREAPESEQYMFSEISFVCSRKNPRVQIADLFTRETMKTYDNRFGPVRRPPRKSWQALRDTGRFHIEAIADRWFESLREQMKTLQESTGVTKEDYLRWLQQYKVQHSTTNLFRYIQYGVDSPRQELS